MPGRQFVGATGYAYGFGGQLKDDEISGNSNSYTAEFWQYDPRLGRRWNIDPVIKPWESSYASFYNNPLNFVDPYGLTGEKKDPNNIHDENGDGVSTSNEGCGNTTGTWETHNAGGFTGQTAAPFELKPIEVYSDGSTESTGHVPTFSEQLEQTFWMGGGGKFEFDQTGTSLYASNPFYKRTTFQKNQYKLADNAPIAAAGAVATPFVLGGAITVAPLVGAAVGDATLTGAAHIIIRWEAFTGSLSGLGSGGILLGRNMDLVRETAEELKLATIRMPAVLQWGQRIAPQLTYNRLWLQYNLKAGTPINMMTNVMGGPTWYMSQRLNPSVFMDMELKMVQEWFSK